MELRVLGYFLAVIREQSILRAAESLHLSQPTLSRQLRDLEEELGKQLFIRGSRKIVLTEEGMILRKRAEEIFELVQKAKSEVTLSGDTVTGEITIGAGETEGMRFLMQAANCLREDYPNIRFHIHSGDGADVAEKLERGIIDFGLLYGQIDSARYEMLELPHADRFGVLMRRDAPLADRETIRPSDLWEQPLIVSRQNLQSGGLAELFGKDVRDLNIAGTYSLLFNASLMVEEGLGYAIGFDRIINVTGESKLCFRPLSTGIGLHMNFVWKKNQKLTRAAEKYLELVQRLAEKQ